MKTHRHRWRWWLSSSSFECWIMLSYWPGLLSKAQSFYFVRHSPYETVDIILFLGPAPPSFSCFVCQAQGLLPLHSHHQSTFRDIFTLGSAPRALSALLHLLLWEHRLGNTPCLSTPMGKTLRPAGPEKWLTLSYVKDRSTRNGFSIIKIILINLHVGWNTCMFIYQFAVWDVQPNWFHALRQIF